MKRYRPFQVPIKVVLDARTLASLASGAVGVSGVVEKDINLRLFRNCRKWQAKALK